MLEEMMVTRKPFSSNPEVEEEYIKPTKPTMLRKILDHRNQQNEESDLKYNEFLSMAENAVNEMKRSNLQIKSRFDFKYASSDNVQRVRKEGNQSLNVIFMFYAQLTQDTQTTTFSAHDLANETMDIQELIIFCKDFNITPHLLTRDDIQLLWKGVMRSRKNDVVAFIALEFEDFADMLVRIALYACNKPEIKRYIASLNGGSMLEPIQQVDFFAKLIKLDNYPWVLNNIKTVGRESQGNLHCRSADDKRKDISTIRGMADVERIAMRAKSKSRRRVNFSQKKIEVNDKDDDDDEEDDDDDDCKPVAKKSNMVDLESDNIDDSSCDPKDSFIYRPEESKIETVVSAVYEEKAVMRDYDPSFSHTLLEKYNFLPVKVESESFSSEGPFIDMGTLPVGANCVITLKVKNICDDDVRLDVITKNFSSSNVTTQTYSRELIPGFTFKATIKFNVEPGSKSVLGKIEVYNLDVRRKVMSQLVCPVFYRVSEAEQSQNLNPKLKLLSVAALTAKMNRQKSDKIKVLTKKFDKSCKTHLELKKTSYSTMNIPKRYDSSRMASSSGPLIAGLDSKMKSYRK
jgi:hypothetical protein